jgi:hypothetical protein
MSELLTKIVIDKIKAPNETINVVRELEKLLDEHSAIAYIKYRWWCTHQIGFRGPLREQTFTYPDATAADPRRREKIIELIKEHNL